MTDIDPGLKLALYEGDAWRCESGYENDRGTSAADVVRFERDELGNEHINPGPDVLAALESIPYARLVWACRSAQDAMRYGNEPYEVIVGHDARIVADDPDGGYLIWIRDPGA